MFRFTYVFLSLMRLTTVFHLVSIRLFIINIFFMDTTGAINLCLNDLLFEKGHLLLQNWKISNNLYKLHSPISFTILDEINQFVWRQGTHLSFLLVLFMSILSFAKLLHIIIVEVRLRCLNIWDFKTPDFVQLIHRWKFVLKYFRQCDAVEN